MLSWSLLGNHMEINANFEIARNVQLGTLPFWAQREREINAIKDVLENDPQWKGKIGEYTIEKIDQGYFCTILMTAF